VEIDQFRIGDTDPWAVSDLRAMLYDSLGFTVAKGNRDCCTDGQRIANEYPNPTLGDVTYIPDLAKLG
jgi:hypothetical protein